VERLSRWQILIESPGNSKPMIRSAISFCSIRGPSKPKPLAVVLGGAGSSVVEERDGGRLLREKLDEDHKEPSGPRESAREWRVAGCCHVALLLFSAVVSTP
jgi:hypothetical protein